MKTNHLLNKILILLVLSIICSVSIQGANTTGYTDISECKNLADDGDRYYCVMSFAPFSNLPLSICDIINDPQNLFNCYQSVARSNNDLNFCEEIPYSTNIATNLQYVQFCLIPLAHSKNDPGICNMIPDNPNDANFAYWKNACRQQVTPTSTSAQTQQQSSWLSSWLYSNLVYIIGGIILLAILIFLILKIIKRKPKEKKPEKGTEKEPEKVKEKETKISIPSGVSEAISIKNFTVKHGKSLILDNVELDIKRGELVCLLGPSGTGKSTIIEAIVGRASPTKGNIKIFDKDIKDKKIYAQVGFVPQHPEIYMNQTVEQNLLSSATKWGLKDAKKKVDEIMSNMGISKRRDLKASKLSGGQSKLLSLGMELIRDPELLILDEPTTGLDPNTRNGIITILSRIVTKQQKTVFFTTHFMDDAEECDEVIIIAKGKIVAQGAPSKLESRLPGNGRIVNIILDNVTEDLLKDIQKIEGIEKVISEGRNIKIITDEPNAVKLAQKIDELGGVVNKSEITDATMKEVFVYYTGEEVKE